MLPKTPVRAEMWTGTVMLVQTRALALPAMTARAAREAAACMSNECARVVEEGEPHQRMALTNYITMDEALT